MQNFDLSRIYRQKTEILAKNAILGFKQSAISPEGKKTETATWYISYHG